MNAEARKPNLFIVGAPKCGTTAWLEYLASHPDIFFPDSKEDCFFALDLPNFRFIHSEREYSKLFAGCGDTKIVGEASAMYLFSEEAARAMHQFNPAAKILIFLRDQEDFLPSLHNQFLLEFSEEIENFKEAWRLSGRRSSDSVPPACLEPRTLDYAAMGRFAEQVERYLRVFPADQVRVIHYRDWIADPRAAYLQILDFLGVDDDGRADFPVVNQAVTYRLRGLVRFLLFPPASVRKVARLVKRVTGLEKLRSYPATEKAIDLLSAKGYRNKISPELRDEIKAYYAEENRRLDTMLASVRSSQE